MAYYNTCPNCGSNLDPGEKCLCQNEKEKKQEFFKRYLRMEPGIGQLVFNFNSKEAARESKSYY